MLAQDLLVPDLHRAMRTLRPHPLPAVDWSLVRRIYRLVEPICGRYFRAEVRGLGRVPPGQTILVSNHDGGLLPVDGLAFGAAWHRHFRFARPLRVLMHEMPFRFGRRARDLLHGIGCISAAASNFEALLDGGESVLVYPGAAREAYRPYRRRARIDLGGRSGFIVRALRRRLPVTPVASVGAHETMFILAQGRRLAEKLGIKRRFRADAWPLVVGLPWGIWFGPMWPFLPLPAKLTIEVQEPIDLGRALGRRLDPCDADDPETVRRAFEAVRGAVQAGVRRLYAERRWPVIG